MFGQSAITCATFAEDLVTSGRSARLIEPDLLHEESACTYVQYTRPNKLCKICPSKQFNLNLVQWVLNIDTLSLEDFRLRRGKFTQQSHKIPTGFPYQHHEI